MNRIALTILLLLLCPHKATCQKQISAYDEADKFAAFHEEYDDNSNSWNTENLWITSNVNFGYYTIKCNNYQHSSGLSCKPLPINQNQDYAIEAKIKINEGRGGLVLGMNSRYDHIRIEIDEKAKLSVIRDTPSSQKIKKLYSGSIKKTVGTEEFIKIAYQKTGDITYLFINDIFVKQFLNLMLEGDQIGFNVGIDSEIVVDYLKISYLKPSDKPLYVELIALNTGLTGADRSIGQESPRINWTSPNSEVTSLESFNARVKARIHSTSPLKSVLVYLNGESRGECSIQAIPGFNSSYEVAKLLNFGPDENSVYIVATNTVGATKSNLRYFKNPSAIAPTINWEIPIIANTLVGNSEFSVEACISTATELKSAKIIVNGDVQFEGSVFHTPDLNSDCSYSWRAPVILKKGDNDIFIVATNAAGSATSEKRTIRLEDELPEKRLALVLGNSEYGAKPTLKNPVNDANLMEATLKQLGFDVIKRLNADQKEMTEAVRIFSGNLPEYDVALFYYAGHGLQVENVNYLIPTDAMLKNKEDCSLEAFQVNLILEVFNKFQENTNIVILDACRDDPFAEWEKGGEGGFKAMSLSSGTIVSFATSVGSTAADGRGNNGLYTEELTKQMMIPQAIESVFKKTRSSVYELSNEKQEPVEWSKLNGEFYFKK